MTLDQIPEVATASELAQASYDIALAVEIDSPEMLAIASDELREITGRRKKIEEMRLSLTRPLDESKKRIMDLFRVPTERLEQAEQLLRKGVLTYQQSEREKAEKARREAEAALEAERRGAEEARREAERLEREAKTMAADADTAAEREAALKAADQAALARSEAEARVEVAEVAPLPAIAEVPQAQGVSTRKIWKAEVVDFKGLVLAAAERAQRGDETFLAFLLPDTKALAGAARSMRNKLSVPGVRVYAEESLSVRGAP
ncbi:MAG: hypothetical protein KGL35_11575 [Bradyrhizobium sp.]|jgi:membrane protein involved in colicin uptake|nr:hypothetical protein [Bradyrhizobium sp.]